MSRIQIVTDSSIYYANPALMGRRDVVVLPMYVRFGSERLQLGVDIDRERFIERMRYDDVIPELEPASVEEIYEVYNRLHHTVNEIVSIHISNHLCPMVQNAVAASKMLLGRCDIHVIDSLTISYGASFLVEQSLLLVQTLDTLDDVVREIRRMIPRIYSVFFVESMKVLSHRQLLGDAQTILGTMLGVMPFVTIEEGQLTIMEKALNAGQAVDKLIEFASEFTSVEGLVVLHYSSSLTWIVRQLQDRLGAELGTVNFPTEVYDGSVAALLGPDASGIVIFESEYEDEYH